MEKVHSTSKFHKAGLRLFRSKTSVDAHSQLMLTDKDGIVLIKFDEIVTHGVFNTAHKIFFAEQQPSGSCVVEEVWSPSTTTMDFMFRCFTELQHKAVRAWFEFMEHNFKLYQLNDALLLVNKHGEILSRFEEVGSSYKKGNELRFSTMVVADSNGELVGENISNIPDASPVRSYTLAAEIKTLITRFALHLVQIGRIPCNQEETCLSMPMSVIGSLLKNYF